MDQLGINLGFLIAQIINFLIVFGLMTYFGWGPLLKFLDGRSEKIAKGLEDARVAAEARANAEAEAKKILDKARVEAQALINEARASAEERAKPVLAAAEQEAAKIRQDAQTRAEEARLSALSDVRGQVVNLAMAAANRLIGESLKVDEKQRTKIVDEFFTTATRRSEGFKRRIERDYRAAFDQRRTIRTGKISRWQSDRMAR